MGPMFPLIVHADWSVSPGKRWVVWARRDAETWRVGRPAPVPDPAALVTALLAARARGPVLAGFDFPIGLPLAYGRQTGLAGFRDALAAFGSAPGWREVYAVATQPAEVSLRRPFFPRTALKGTRRDALVQGLGLAAATDLLRLCEHAAGPTLRQACPVFWTLGANQVGRAAIAGWQGVVAPALAAGARLWPFDGSLDALTRDGGLVLAETYPADAYGRVGAPFGPRASKRRQADRSGRAGAVLAWAAASGVDLTACASDLADGFGPGPSGDDAFDALLGALGMIPVVEGRRAAMPGHVPASRLAWEGWILGRPMPRPVVPPHHPGKNKGRSTG